MNRPISVEIITQAADSQSEQISVYLRLCKVLICSSFSFVTDTCLSMETSE